MEKENREDRSSIAADYCAMGNGDKYKRLKPSPTELEGETGCNQSSNQQTMAPPLYVPGNRKSANAGKSTRRCEVYQRDGTDQTPGRREQRPRHGPEKNGERESRQVEMTPRSVTHHTNGWPDLCGQGSGPYAHHKGKQTLLYSHSQTCPGTVSIKVSFLLPRIAYT
jgi:hypothetical protein